MPTWNNYRGKKNKEKKSTTNFFIIKNERLLGIVGHDDIKNNSMKKQRFAA